MLRQLISQLQELSQLQGSHSLNHLPHGHNLFHCHPNQRWCPSDADDRSLDCYSLPVVASGRSRNLSIWDTTPRMPSSSKKQKKDRNQGKSTENASPCEPMDELIWKDFPEDLFEAVIARLPVPSFFQFRTVCRKWNSFLESESFSKQCTQIQQRYPWFYTITHENANSGALYNPSHKKWLHRTIPTLPTKMIVLPVASSGGLVCFLDVGHRNFYVCNPLTCSTKELPVRSVRVWSRVAVGMTSNADKSGYKVVWVGANGEYEVYDSIKGLWSQPGTIPPGVIRIPLSLNFRSQVVSVGSKLYFMRSEPEGIVSYDTSTCVWAQLLIPLPPHLTDHTLAECEGRVMLAGLVTKNAATCMCIWELQRMTLLWKEVDRMPNLLCLEFYGKHVRMTCLGNRGLLMVSLRSRQMNRLVSYDMASHEWLKVPGCVVPCGKKRQWIACGTSFYPCLTATA
jgi:hypothetical protein